MYIGRGREIPDFSVILIIVVLMVMGAAVIPLLSIRYIPSSRQNNLVINYTWSGASAKALEQQVTSKLEGVIAPISGVEKIESLSGKNGGTIDVTFKKRSDADMIRFEIASKIKQIYPHLPQGVSYPTLSSSISGLENQPILTYTVNADMPGDLIADYVNNHITPPLQMIDGVKQVEVSGEALRQWVVMMDYDKCRAVGINISDIKKALSEELSVEPLGITVSGDCQRFGVSLKGAKGNIDDISQIVIKNIDGRLVTLGQIATVENEEAPAQSYYRFNGLNNINISVTADQNTNTLKLSELVRGKIEQLEGTLPVGISIELVSDSSEFVDRELSKIYFRSGFSLLILLAFVFLVSRSWRYLILIITTLTANVLIAFIFYKLTDLELHLYSLAGITVSLGLIIDTSIIMTDHYGRYKNMKVMTAILAALLTTIGSLSVVFFLPDGQRANLIDFAAVIVINLTVSMFISMFFIPAILNKYPIRTLTRPARAGSRHLRQVVGWTHFYRRYISWGRSHRWVYIMAIVLGFGIPLNLLPRNIDIKNTDRVADTVLASDWAKIYNKTVGSDLYQQSIKKVLEPVMGGSLRLFMRNSFGSSSSFWQEPAITTLSISASLPDGCTVSQLNETVKQMERFIAALDGIKSFKTEVLSYNDAMISVTFTPEAEKAGQQFDIKDNVTKKAISLADAVWGIYGVGNGFNNDWGGSGSSDRITLSGYNYDQLYKYAQLLADTISCNKRVANVEIRGALPYYYERGSSSEFYLNFDFERFALYGVTPHQFYEEFEQQLHYGPLATIYNNNEAQTMVLVSSEHERFDAWHAENDIVKIKSQNVKLAELGSIAKRLTGNDIYKTNQQYSLVVAYNFIGSAELSDKTSKRYQSYISSELPVGYKASIDRMSWWDEEPSLPYYLILLIVAIIFFTCSVLFESLLEPLAIILIIPVSFIGLFLTFGLFSLEFDHGGFASMVLLCGLVVNAGIYIINDYNHLKGHGLTGYLRAFNRKIIPVLLTATSTVLGLTPFIVISREPFWFCFAVGAVGGMVFSILAIVFILPIFIRFSSGVADRRYETDLNS